MDKVTSTYKTRASSGAFVIGPIQGVKVGFLYIASVATVVLHRALYINPVSDAHEERMAALLFVFFLGYICCGIYTRDMC